MTERLTSADPIEAWRKAAERAENPATWRVGDELRRVRDGSVGWVRGNGVRAVLILCHDWRETPAVNPRWVAHHDAAREWRRRDGNCPDDIED